MPYFLYCSKVFWHCPTWASSFWLSTTQDLYCDSRSFLDSSTSWCLFSDFWLSSSSWQQAPIAFSLLAASSTTFASRPRQFSCKWDFSFSFACETCSRYKQRTSRFWLICRNCAQLLSRSWLDCSSLADLFFICSQTCSRTLHLASNLWLAASSILTGNASCRADRLFPTPFNWSRILSISDSKCVVMSLSCLVCFSPNFWWPLKGDQF